ncbi:alpha/beta hydrolase fold domain-containing protein [Klenkia taihuensis]|uniref:Acetyl esterase/lipase n=1 Tax=Klenkia taihuensis TaxID=1225127 RepID=A0A1I1U4G5_9ACTN|nr:alpha/beta hydrolase [Klenkia taihuensis]GHE06941.1 carboxylesterase [Klenkia taihuensis]SFD65659.1 Acetyl esterase/lipase [Klenkia taihuensis]
MPDIVAHLQARFLATVVTRLIAAPSVELTSREVPAAQTVSVPTRHGAIRCFITHPAAGAPLNGEGTAPPVHINIHGGAFLIGAPRQDDHLVRAIAGEVGAVVINIDYSTAPQARYPQAHEECYDVLRWVQSSGDRMGWDSGRVSIGGGSAGGNLALGVLQLAHQNGDPALRAGVLVVPSVDQTIPAHDYTSPVGSESPAPFVSPGLVRSIQVTYFAEAARRPEALASPVLADGEMLAALPPLLVLSAELDSLRPQIEHFAERARAAGAELTYTCLDGVDHDFPVRPKGDRPLAALREAATFMQDHLLHHLR